MKNTVVMLTLGAIFGCQSLPEVETITESATEAIKNRGKLVMLCNPHMESRFVRANLDRGPTRRVGTVADFVGFDVDLLSAFAEFLGVKLEIRTLDEPGYSGLIPALNAGKADLVASSLSITPQRSKVVDFSDPYFVVVPVIVARKNSGIHEIDDLHNRIGVTIKGSSHEEHLMSLGLKASNLEYVAFTTDYFGSILEAAPEFALMDSSSAAIGLQDAKELGIALRLEGDDSYAIAIRKGSDLLEQMNFFLAKARSDGEIDRLLKRHLYDLQDTEGY